jgi:hypothetical protein
MYTKITYKAIQNSALSEYQEKKDNLNVHQQGLVQ